MTDQVVEKTETADVAEISTDSKNMAMLCHILAIFFGFIPSLIFYLVKADDAFIKEHAKEGLNAAISFFAYYFVAGILTMIVIGIFMFPILGICWLVFNILAAVKASKGEFYKFPLIFRLVK
jgi:uncharacterized protein